MSIDLAVKALLKKIDTLFYEESEGKIVKRELKYMNIAAITVSHGIAIYGLLFRWYRLKWQTTVFWMVFNLCGGLGVTAGVHRLWCHRSYKAKIPLRILLATFFSMAGQNSIIQWVLDHRVHHRFTETDADPHNAARGFFFSHVGWLMQNKSKAVKSQGKQVDMSDVQADPVVQFFEKNFLPFKIFFAFIIPTVVPVYMWKETLADSIIVPLFLRYMLLLNFTWSVNSAAHIYGKKPYDNRIGPAENKAVSYMALGEGHHNYHHVFPWDYKTGELGLGPNWTTSFLNFFARIGLAYDLKTPSKELIDRVSAKHGDGSRFIYEEPPPKEGEDGDSDAIRIIDHEEIINK